MRRYFFLLLFIGFVASASAEVVLLSSGKKITGTILLQNDEVVIIKDASGVRFQFPKSDVKSISADEVLSVQEEGKPEEMRVTTAKKVAMSLQVMGGLTVLPHASMGGCASVDMLIGTHNLAGRKIFVGGGVGYHGAFYKGAPLHFLPVQMAVYVPVTLQKHAPIVGLAAGYGVALSKDYLGGAYLDANVGYRYEIGANSSLFVALDVRMQQAKIAVSESLSSDGQSYAYAHTAGRSLVDVGVRVGVFF